MSPKYPATSEASSRTSHHPSRSQKNGRSALKAGCEEVNDEYRGGTLISLSHGKSQTSSQETKDKPAARMHSFSHLLPTEDLARAHVSQPRKYSTKTPSITSYTKEKAPLKDIFGVRQVMPSRNGCLYESLDDVKPDHASDYAHNSNSSGEAFSEREQRSTSQHSQPSQPRSFKFRNPSRSSSVGQERSRNSHQMYHMKAKNGRHWLMVTDHSPRYAQRSAQMREVKQQGASSDTTTSGNQPDIPRQQEKGKANCKPPRQHSSSSLFNHENDTDLSTRLGKSELENKNAPEPIHHLNSTTNTKKKTQAVAEKLHKKDNPTSPVSEVIFSINGDALLARKLQEQEFALYDARKEEKQENNAITTQLRGEEDAREDKKFVDPKGTFAKVKCYDESAPLTKLSELPSSFFEPGAGEDAFFEQVGRMKSSGKTSWSTSLEEETRQLQGEGNLGFSNPEGTFNAFYNSGSNDNEIFVEFGRLEKIEKEKHKFTEEVKVIEKKTAKDRHIR